MPKLNSKLKKFLICTSSGLETILEVANEDAEESEEYNSKNLKPDFSNNLYVISEEE